ncbi:MAG: ATP/GTP-binding protein [Bacteroidetes bacterium]|nr:ATP/GTP-binding protein [Bacteroidota bacterium]
MSTETPTQYLKLVISGSVNAGKTTFIRTISEIEPITTDEWASEESVKEKKSLTTVALDYGRLTVDESLILNIYGTPGQKRFDFMWEILSEKAFGAIFLADSTSHEDIENTKKIIEYFNIHVNLPYIICVTKLDLTETIGFEKVVSLFIDLNTTIIPINTTIREDVKTALLTLLTEVIQNLE